MRQLALVANPRAARATLSTNDAVVFKTAARHLPPTVTWGMYCQARHWHLKETLPILRVGGTKVAASPLAEEAFAYIGLVCPEADQKGTPWMYDFIGSCTNWPHQ